MRPGSARRLCVIESLTLRTWLTHLLPWLARRARADRSQAMWLAIDASAIGWRLAQWSCRLAGCRLERLAFRLIALRDAEGLSIRLRLGYCDWAPLQAAVLSQPAFRAALAWSDAPPSWSVYLGKRIATMDKAQRRTWWRAMQVIQACAWRRRTDPACRDVALWIERRPGMPAVARYAAEEGVAITSYRPTFDWRRTVADLVGPRRLRMMSHLRLHLAAAGRRVRGRELQTPTLLVQYYGQLNVDAPGQYSDLFFWQGSPIPGRDVALLFNLPPAPLDQAKMDVLRRVGMRAIVTHPQASTITGVSMSLPPVRLPRRRGVQHPARTDRLDARWIEQSAVDYDATRQHWRRLSQRHGMKIYVTWYKYDATHCAIAQALEETGGVLALYQRAYDSHPSAETAVLADLFFGYSSATAAFERQSGSRIRYHVATGYLGDHLFAALRQPAAQLRQRLQASGAQRIIAFTDENSADDPRWHTDHEFIRRHYAFLLERLLEEPWVGLIIKPKVPATLRRRLGPVAPLLARAEATGRCVVLEGGALHGSHPPALAAMASDVLVHGHLCAPTAGLESALAGAPTLLMDGEGWAISPLYRLGVGRVVFTEWSALWDACQDHWKRPGGAPGFGDWSALLPELDPFRDGRAAQRMGQYLAWVLEGLREGRGRERAMAHAAERYAKRWGADKVMAIDGPGRPMVSGGDESAAIAERVSHG